MKRIATVALLATLLPFGCSSAQAASAPTPARIESALYAAKAPAAVLSLELVKRRLEARRGRVVVLHLWASWCEPCLRELPMIAELARDMRGKGVDIFSVSVDQANRRNAQRVGQLIDQNGGTTLTRAIVHVDDADDFVAAIDPRWRGTIPALFAFGRDGALGATLVGESHRDQVESVLNGLLAKP